MMPLPEPVTILPRQSGRAGQCRAGLCGGGGVRVWVSSSSAAAPAPPITLRAPPPEPRAPPPLPPPQRAPRPAPAGDVRAKRAGRAPPSRVLPRVLGSPGPRGGAAPRGLDLPPPLPRALSRCPAGPALQPETRKKGECWREQDGTALRALRSPGHCLGGGGAGTCVPLPHSAAPPRPRLRGRRGRVTGGERIRRRRLGPDECVRRRRLRSGNPEFGCVEISFS